MTVHIVVGNSGLPLCVTGWTTRVNAAQQFIDRLRQSGDTGYEEKRSQCYSVSTLVCG